MLDACHGGGGGKGDSKECGVDGDSLGDCNAGDGHYGVRDGDIKLIWMVVMAAMMKTLVTRNFDNGSMVTIVVV